MIPLASLLECFIFITTTHCHIELSQMKVVIHNMFIRLQESMARAMEDYPESCAVLVRRHGVFVWGENWQKAKTM